MKKLTYHLILILIFFISCFTGAAKIAAHVYKTYFLFGVEGANKKINLILSPILINPDFKYYLKNQNQVKHNKHLLWIFKILNKLLSKTSFGLIKKMQNAYCKINEVDTWATPDFSLTKKDFLFCLSYSKNCNLMDWAIISL